MTDEATSTRPSFRIAARTGDALGEAPLWHPVDGLLYWLDLVGGRLHRMDGEGRVETRPLDRPPPLGAIVAGDSPGRLIFTASDGVWRYDWATNGMEPLANPEAGREAIGFNDAKVDRWGRLWIGTSDLTERDPRGALWCWAPGSPPVLADAGFTVVNGPAFSPDGTVLYLSDSVGRRVLAYDLAPDAAGLRNRRVFAEMAVDECYPDGLTVDAEGGLWVAHWDGWRVTRFSPEGERTLVIPLPVPRVTSVAFGGPALSVLFATSARLDLSAALLDAAPLSGALFAVDTGFSGIAETTFRS